MTEYSNETQLRMKALMLNGQIIGQLNKAGLEMYVDEIQTLAEELDSVEVESE